MQITNVTRDASDAQVTSIVYYMESYGNITEAQVLLDLMSYFRIQEVALILGREVVVMVQCKLQIVSCASFFPTVCKALFTHDEIHPVI